MFRLLEADGFADHCQLTFRLQLALHLGWLRVQAVQISPAFIQVRKLKDREKQSSSESENFKLAHLVVKSNLSGVVHQIELPGLESEREQPDVLYVSLEACVSFFFLEVFVEQRLVVDPLALHGVQVAQQLTHY